jgi:fructose-1,6-bisphosphatase/inositol monophosphatase family enzyme
MNSYLITRVVAAAVQVSRKAARIIREIKVSGSLETKEKGFNDYVTKADFQSQMCIIRSLEKMFPKVVFCGEEGVGGYLFHSHLNANFYIF